MVFEREVDGEFRQLLPSAHGGQGGIRGAATSRGVPCLGIWETWCQQGLLAGVRNQKGSRSGATVRYPFQSALKYMPDMDEEKEWLWPGYPQEPGLGTTQIQKQIPTACRGMSYFLSTVGCELGPPALKPGTSHPETCQQASSKAFSPSLLSTFLSCVRCRVSKGCSGENNSEV